ncbi:MAG: amidohydrolase family protein [Candidatus Cloacimonadales bacterium]
MPKIDLIIKNGYILDFNKSGSEFEPEDLVIDQGKIIFIGTQHDYTANEIIDATEKIVMPGFINTHTHVAMSYFKGMADDLPLMQWLNQHIWPAEKKFLAAEFVYDAALFGCAELIKNGVTTFNDMYFFQDRLAAAAEKLGIRASLGEAILETPNEGKLAAERTLQRTEQLVQQYRSHPLIEITVAPHAIYTCSTETLQKARDLAGKLGALQHIHLSETKFEVEESLKKYGKRPAKYLADLGFFDNPTLAAHSHWLDEEEQKIYAENGVAASINASSNYKLTSGINAFDAYHKNRVNLSFGTDSVASNNKLSMFAELNLFGKVQKALTQNPQFLPARQLLKMATLNGAEALGKGQELGSLEIGKKADLITVNLNCLQAQPIYNLFSQLAYSLDSEQIIDEVIDGKTVMHNRKLVNIDEAELLEKAKFWRRKIMTR